MNPMPTSMGTLTFFAGSADRLNTNGFDLMNRTSWRPMAVDGFNGFDEKQHVFQTQKNWQKLTQMGRQHRDHIPYFWSLWSATMVYTSVPADVSGLWIWKKLSLATHGIRSSQNSSNQIYKSLTSLSHGNQIKHLPLYLLNKSCIEHFSSQLM
jgi:hypothetical protein